MIRLRLRTPSRLHFGLLSWGSMRPRQFGGIGLMIEAPGLEITAEPADGWRAEGLLASRVLEVAPRVAGRLASRGLEVRPARLEVRRAPTEHVGLGVGTQLGLGIARLLATLAGFPEPTIGELAELAGRGLRSGIGLHGFALGGLIVDGGRRGPEGIPPLLSRVEFPAEWSVLVLTPRRGPGLHGPGEVRAFAELPPSPDALTDRLCRLVLLGLLPAAIERDLVRFGEALDELQQRVGQGFAPAQGGTFARPELETIAGVLRSEGLQGVGQSSWGPTLYGFLDAPADRRAAVLARILERTGLPPGAGFWTSASLRGASLDSGSPEPET
jgi:beta-ribofuranosylaminobenzene 5'-phosphate synthase